MHTDITKLPHQPWVYIFKSKADKILYIWKAKDIYKRVSQYFTPGSVWKQEMVAKAEKIDYFIVLNEKDALSLEINLINQHKPPYNSLLKWDTSYVYIKITNETYPQIYFTRFKDDDGAVYLGPKYYRQDLKKLLELLRQLFAYRWCKNTQFRQGKLCSDYFFGICKGWCVYNKLKQINREKFLADANKFGFQPQCDYEESIKEYQKIIKVLVDFFKWNSKSLEKVILEKIEEAVQKQHFEWAARLRDIYFNLQKFVDKQTVVLEKDVTGYFVHIKKIGQYNAYSLMYFFEGKLIDIITGKEQESEVEYDELLATISQDTWELQLLWQDEQNSFYLGFPKKLVDKSSLEELKKLSDKFMETLILSSTFEKQNLMDELLKNLQQKYSLSRYPYTISCLDISHLSGWWVSGAISAIQAWFASKKLYRHYKIQASIDKSTYNNDYEALKEVIIRKFKIKKDSYETQEVDLFIIDGWLGQLHVLQEIAKQMPIIQKLIGEIQFASLGKWQARKTAWKLKWNKEILFVLKSDFSISQFELDYDESDRILVKARDEAHRFSNRYRKIQMKNEFK